MTPTPPRLAQLILSWLAVPADRSFLMADLAEEFDSIVELRGSSAAARWYWLQMFGSMAPCLRRHARVIMRRRIPALQSLPEGNTTMKIRLSNLFETTIGDIRYGLRCLLKSPVFTVVAVFSLAMGIGANTAMFSMINVLLLRQLPAKDPSRLVLFSPIAPHSDGFNLPYPVMERLRKDGKSFDSVFASAGATYFRLDASGGGNTANGEIMRAERVSGNLFVMLGINAIIGRTLSDDDDRPNNPNPVAVISYNLWKTKFGLDPSVLGKPITIDDEIITIVGVAPQAFNGIEVGSVSDVWYPIWMMAKTANGASRFTRFSSSWITMFGRLKTGVTAKQAQAEVDVIYRQLLVDQAGPAFAKASADAQAEYLNRRIELQPGGAGFSRLRKKFTQPLYILMTTVGLVLLIACANVANLLLARAATRQKEIAVRLAIGAGRFRLIRQLLTESVLLSVLGGVLGLVFSIWASRLLVNYVTSGQRVVTLDLHLDFTVLSFTLGISILTGILFGLAPALRATGFDLIPALKDSSTSLGAGKINLGIDKILVITQVALSLFLLIGAGLFVRTLQNLKSVAGFDAENILVFSVDSVPRYTSQQKINLFSQILARLETLPGARSASVSNFYLLKGDADAYSIEVPGYTPQKGEEISGHTLLVGPRFFETMGIPIVLGRDFTEADNQVQVGVDQSPASLPAVINQTMSDRYFGRDNPVGKHFVMVDKDRVGFEVVGVVKDAKYQKLRETTPPIFYAPIMPSFKIPAFAPAVGASTAFELRTFGNPASAIAAIQREVKSIDKDSQAAAIKTMSEIVDQAVIQERFVAQVASFFSLFALVLASLGLYGIMSYSVSRRTKEMGIRIALGAEPWSVVWMILRQSLVLVLIGVCVAIPASFGATRFVSTLLFGLTSADPFTAAIATLILLTVAVLAGYIPARRASRIDPMVALRYE